MKTIEVATMKGTLLMLSLLFPLGVQAAQMCKTTIPQSTPDSRFSISSDEVTDTMTGLIWQRCSLGQSGIGCTTGSAATYTWSGALQAAENASATTGKAWRLPNVKELRSLVEEACHSPAINLTLFPNTPSSLYWSASPYASYSGNAWDVRFRYGDSYNYYKGDYGYVRLVRGGQ